MVEKMKTEVDRLLLARKMKKKLNVRKINWKLFFYRQNKK